MNSLRSRKRNWIGHVLRGEGFLKEVIEGRMEGKRIRGRPRLGMLDNLIMHSYEEMKRKTEDRDVGDICHGPAISQYTERES